MEKDTRSVLTGCMVIGALLIIWSFFLPHGKSPAQKNIIVIATVHKLTDTNGHVKVDVDYNYQGKVLNNSFTAANADSLKPNGKIRLLVAPQNPDKQIKYIGIAQ
jgi:hypothetical protein